MSLQIHDVAVRDEWKPGGGTHARSPPRIIGLKHTGLPGCVAGSPLAIEFADSPPRRTRDPPPE